MTTVYLDNCCFNRPFDDQLHPLVKLETESKIFIQEEIANGKLNLVWSFMLHYENSVNPFIDRRKQVGRWETMASQFIPRTPEVQALAAAIMPLGIKHKDAVHIACAITANADYFITTDKKLLNKNIENILIINPMDFTRRHFHED